MKTLHQKECSGAAIMIVLALLVLLSAMLVLFLQTTGGMRKTTLLIAEQERSRQMAQLAVGQVSDSILTATSGVDGSGVVNELWVSQPGMIRVFGQGGAFKEALKLYSAAQSSVSDADQLSSSVADDLPSDWEGRPREFVNLNAPSSSGEYPILDPSAENQVEGIDPGGDAVMPVRWWYVKADGSFSPDADGDVVGRVAWWTDDETAKLNVNTASEGTYYSQNYVHREMDDLPGHGGLEAPYGPTTHEYNAMPSHPAATSLSVAFREGLFSSGATQQEMAKWFVDSSPHLLWGGTEGLSLASMVRYSLTFPATFTANGMEGRPFYASVDDYLERNRQRASNATISATEAQTLASRARFAVTDHNAGNSLNPFGKPRISLWPIPANSSHRTTFDEKMALASTYANREYYFVRRYPASPGAAGGGALSTSEDILEARNLALINQFRTDTTGSRMLPGIAGSNRAFATKYGVDWPYVIGGIFDFIRTTNLVDSLRTGVTGTVNAANMHRMESHGSYVDFRNSVNPFNRVPERSGTVAPTRRTGNINGFGRFPVITEAAIHIFHIGETASDHQLAVALYFDMVTPVAGYPAMHPLADQVLASNVVIDLHIAEQNGTVHKQKVTIPAGTARTYYTSAASGGWEHHLRTGGIHGMAIPISPTEAFYRPGHPGHQNPAPYAFMSGPINFPKGLWTQDPVPTLSMGTEGSSGGITGPISFQLRQWITAGFTQNYQFSFPLHSSLPLPAPENLPISRRLVELASATTSDSNYQPSPSLIRPGDIVRSLELRDGDPRVLAYTNSVPVGQYVKHRDYDSSNRRAQNLRAKAWKQYGFSPNEVVQGEWIAGLGLPLPQRVHASIDNLYDVKAHYDMASSFVNGFPESGWARDIVTAPLMSIRSDEAGLIQDGPWILKAQEQTTSMAQKSPYSPAVIRELFTPYLQVPSPVVLGTLPTGVGSSLNAASRANSKPFQTLLFAPNPLGPMSGTHPGLETPRDHYLLNYFHMPVVDPYLMSPLGSSYGQVNLNQQIIPFTGIKRTTAISGLLKGLRMHAIPDSIISTNFSVSPSTTLDAYKTTSSADAAIRLEIDRPETIESWTRHYDTEGGLNVYRYPSEVCDIFLVPKVPTSSAHFPSQPDASSIRTWWNGFRLTGDNLRELPYNYLYPRVTTQSNTYRVHIIAQSLSPAFNRNPAADPARFVTSQWRGSMRLERFLDEDKVRAAGASFNPDQQALTPFFSIRVDQAEVFR